MTTDVADSKIRNDLSVVQEKLDLCQGILSPPAGQVVPSLKNNDELDTLIKWLDACKPRLMELVANASEQSGLLSEAVIGECLAKHDQLEQLQAKIETMRLTETTASTTVASAATAATNEDLLLEETTPAIQPTKSDDEFDAFFQGRAKVDS